MDARVPPAGVVAAVAADATRTTTANVIWMYEAQQKIYSRAVSGWFAGWRWALVWATQLFFYGVPWLQWNGRQAVLFDLSARRFYIGPLVLYPQDFIYLTGLLVVSAFALFLFTTVAGRLWCGFACPQTVYTEIFMWVERQIEGDRMRRMKLDAAPWGFNKLWRKSAKQVVWLAIGLWTGFTFVGYFTPIQTLWASVLTLSLGSWEWFWVLFYGFATYGNAGWLREQVCKYMCPYARFQSVMFDKDTLIISYDAQRGEPRGTRGRKTDLVAAKLGHCIDCELCVQVCPTGIDIRKGLQYECIGCAACIDVCNGVMEKMQYPKGLIRYDTKNSMQAHLSRAEVLRRMLRPRVLAYGAVLLLISGGLLTSLLNRSPFRVDLVHDRGSLARVVDDGWVENVFRLQLMNATELPQRYRLGVRGLAAATLLPDAEVTLGAAQATWLPLAVRVPPQEAARAGLGSHPIQFVVQQLAEDAASTARTVTEKSSFIVPR